MSERLSDAQAFALWLGKWFLIGYALLAIFSWGTFGRDDSDPGSWGARSGLKPATDAATGCQYLRTAGGGITPRLTERGEHMGCRK